MSSQRYATFPALAKGLDALLGTKSAGPLSPATCLPPADLELLHRPVQLHCARVLQVAALCHRHLADTRYEAAPLVPVSANSLIISTH